MLLILLQLKRFFGEKTTCGNSEELLGVIAYFIREVSVQLPVMSICFVFLIPTLISLFEMILCLLSPLAWVLNSALKRLTKTAIAL